jgi:hypothetical protein
MGSTDGGDRPPLVEIGPVPEFWVDGVEVQSLGGEVVRLFLFKERRLPGEGGPGERVIQVEALSSITKLGSIVSALQALIDGAIEKAAVLLN